MAIKVSLAIKKFKNGTSDVRSLIKVWKKIEGKDLKMDIYPDTSLYNVGDGNSHIGFTITMEDKMPLIMDIKSCRGSFKINDRNSKTLVKAV